jgi:putative transposase
MPDIVALLQCFQPFLTATTLGQFGKVIVALLAMTGRVTMLGISRWAGRGGSYRTVQRFFYTTLPWATLFWVFFRHHLLRSEDVYLLAGDEVVVSKAGAHTHGLDRFFAGVYGRVIPGLAFFSLALINTQERRAYPVRIEQVVRSAAEKAARQAKAAAKPAAKPAAPRPRGRPQGSKNKTTTEVSLSPELQRIQALLTAQLNLMAGRIPLAYLVLDGHFGNHPALQMVRQCGLHLISKLRHDAALYLPYEGPYQGHGPHRKYGAKLAYRQLPASCLQRTTIEDRIETRIYQTQARHKEFSQPLNVVIIVKTNLQTQAWAHVVLFSSDLSLAADQLIDYYRLRFQIEIVFTQMTKGRVLACGGRWDHVTDFHRFVVDDDSVNQHLYQLSALGEIELLECRLQAPTEIADAGGELGRVQLLLGLRLELTYLLRQAALGLGELLPLALELGATDDLGQVDLEQARLLALQLGQRSPQGTLAILQRLGEPLTRLGACQFMGDEGRIWQ